MNEFWKHTGRVNVQELPSRSHRRRRLRRYGSLHPIPEQTLFFFFQFTIKGMLHIPDIQYCSRIDYSIDFLLDCIISSTVSRGEHN